MVSKEVQRDPGAKIFLVGAAIIAASSTAAWAECEISSDATTYYELRENAIILMEYGDQVVRATGGKIRCEEDAAGGRQVCGIEGEGEVLIEGDRGLFTVSLTGEEPHELHIYSTGDLTCGLASDF
ncbi:MAG: hypothetical protein AAFP28_03660 [Pseudomonadota bacterium]